MENTFVNDIKLFEKVKNMTHMGQKDQDGYYEEKCHLFSTSELKYTNLKTGPIKSKNM